jgi:hypothetical protein
MNPRQLVAGALLAICLLATGAARPAPAAADTFPTGYNPSGYPTSGCFWTGAFTRSNPVTNVALPGTEITYWAARFVTPPGSTLTLKGAFPYARYSSLNSYKAEGASQSSLTDRDIRPDPGSINPSLAGANRNAANRSYTVTVRGEAPPATPVQNTLFAEPVAGQYQTIVYRVYVPDKGRNLSGGTELPQPTLRLADGSELTGQALCDAMNSVHLFDTQELSLSAYQGLVNSPGKNPATNPAENPIQFSRYYNTLNALARYQTVEQQKAAWAANPNYVGTQYDNKDARYMTGAYSFDFGKVVVLKGKLPTTPKTLNGQKKMTAGQLMLWDMCIIQSLVTTKTWDCVFDEQLPLRGGKKRQYTIVISSKADRPRNARTSCGVWWMQADPDGDGAGRKNIGQLLTRNVLPADNFRQSSWAVPTPFPADAKRVMGSYYPKGSYTSKKRFERGGCSRR